LTDTLPSPARPDEPAGALMLHPNDNVATALRDLAAGETIWVQGPSKALQIRVLEPIALCHKIALEALDRGQSARKYGEVIGSTTNPLPLAGMSTSTTSKVAVRKSSHRKPSRHS